MLVQSPALCLEDLCVCLEQVLPLHSLPAWHGTNQNSHIYILESHIGVVRSDHIWATNDSVNVCMGASNIIKRYYTMM